MTGNRVLRLARALFGDDTARAIFEPLIADFQRECSTRTASRVLVRLRWLAAIAQTFVWCTPRALAVRMPTLLLLDVIGCAIAFPLVAFIFQWPEVRFAGSGRFGWSAVLVASLSFTVIPIVWRFRAAAIPEHQGRALTHSFVLLLSAIAVSLGEGDWSARAAQAVSIVWLAIVGWRLGDQNRPQYFSAVASFFVKIAMVGGCLMVASWPLKLALGIDLLSPYWPRQELLIYTMAWITVVTLKKRFNGFTEIGP